MNALALKNRLPRTWNAFFGRHGRFTPTQLAAIPELLAGENVMLCAPVASGKTEAVLAPLIERDLPPVREIPQLSIIYLLPTRALVNDLSRRLATPLEMLQVSAAVRTHDFNNFVPTSPSDLLLTTPESLDSLLASHPVILNNVKAIIIDELHLFDGTVRGDQLRVLLRRLRQIRAYAARVGDAENALIQYAALSATLAQPEMVASRYFSDVHVVRVESSRTVQIETVPLKADSPGELLDFLRTFRERGWYKALVFCNTRAEVEQYAAAVRASGSVFGESVYVHYSNLERERRYEIEQQFAGDDAAICFASSTLESGIDIGSIDVVMLVGAPGSAESFWQRAGRSGRRGQKAHMVCFYRNALEQAQFDALPTTAMHQAAPGFIPSVAVQQIFSLLKQSPDAAVRFNPLCNLFEGLLLPVDVRDILGELQAAAYLKPARMGEWRAGERLNQLVDRQASEYTSLSLHSNIEVGSRPVKIRDRHSQRIVANVDRWWFDREQLTLEGRSLDVTWYDDDALWVSPASGTSQPPPLHYFSGRQMLSFELAQQLAIRAGLQPDTVSLVQCDEGWLCFHWLGDIYGLMFLDMMRYTLSVESTSQLGLCLLLKDKPTTLPVFTAADVTRCLNDTYRRYEGMLAMGAYHHLLSVMMCRRAVIEQFNVPRYIAATSRLRLDDASEKTAAALLDYLD